ncbi:hypothetical protein VTL71DRAFT_8441 [Oculimacula yallundae]|uniref:Myb-like domain-containing protein n=1 Tax=Oculimacula yallundae TaxID=86028 RepID=A0ABR4CXT5_9HELO
MPSVEVKTGPFSSYDTHDNETSDSTPKTLGQISSWSSKRYSLSPLKSPICTTATPRVIPPRSFLDSTESISAPRSMPQILQPMSIRASSGAWTPSDDQSLIAARAQGLNWAPIQEAYFPTKTPNACRKRHERLMETRSADDWDDKKLENLAKTYMDMRREIWSALAAQTGEKWNVVEVKCMSQGLKNLQTAARSHARRERMLEPSPTLLENFTHTHNTHYTHYCSDSSTKTHSCGDAKIGTTYDGESGTGDEIEFVLEESHVNGDGSPAVRDHTGMVARLSTKQTYISTVVKGSQAEKRLMSENNKKLPSIRPPPSIELRTSVPAATDVLKGCPGTPSLFKPQISPTDKALGALTARETPLTGFHDTEDSKEDMPALNSITRDQQTHPDIDNLPIPANTHANTMLAICGAIRVKLLSMTMKSISADWDRQRSASFRQHLKTPPASDAPAGSSQSPSSPSKSSAATSPGNSVKRGLENDENGDEDREDDNEKKRPRKYSAEASRGEKDNPLRHLCPFRVHDHALFKPRTGTDICGGSWPDIAKLKEHLYRRHYVELQCQRCKVKFTSRSELCQHVESDAACKPLSRQAKHGFTSDIKLVLLSKKRTFPNQEEKDKWKEIYELLFPCTDKVASSFCKESVSGPPAKSSSQEELSLKDFSSLALPEEFSRRAEILIADAVTSLQGQLAQQVSSIVHDSQETINAKYQQMTQISRSFDFYSNDNPVKLWNPQEATLDESGLCLTTEDLLTGMNEHQPTPMSDDTFELSLDSWVTLGRDELPQLPYGTTPSESINHKNFSCYCKGNTCYCQPTKVSHKAMPRESSTSTVDSLGSIDSSSDIMCLLQGMQRSIATLEKKLSAAETSSGR